MIKIGILGMSTGNAHPYSWSAIINGQFDAAEISRVGYPAVAAYLQANQDTLGLPNACVTCVWTQEQEVSKSIAKTTGIKNIVQTAEEMIGQVDAVILSRDDPENHVAMAKSFIDANIPIFIDKPLAADQADLDYFSQENAKGKLIMSCSSMRYSVEARNTKIEFPALGKLELITATGKKDWIKYGVHLLEGVFMLLDDAKPITVKHIGESGKDIVHITFEGGLQVIVNLFMEISGTFQISIFGQQGWRLIEIKNSYAMFRDNIIEFVRSVEQGKSRLDFFKTENIIRTLIAAKESLQQGGKTIRLYH
ncbi:Gfo/Idh/MocA family oxidoreductase [Mucilaginibacter sp.]|uniref:Gfo/Idh/MocA family oxidoreductase n=1 Tax=Mucilaginibacter sp. TaxID=1882438 RepID=UPI003B0049A7